MYYAPLAVFQSSVSVSHHLPSMPKVSRDVLIGKLVAFTAEHHHFELHYVSLQVRCKLGSKVFDGRNLLHLQRFILGRQYNDMLLAVEYRDVVIDLKPLQLPMVAHQVPACIADRITCISEALILHARISQQLQTPFHTLAAAICAGSISLGHENIVPLCLVASAANRARHCDLDKVDLTCSEMDFEWAEKPVASVDAGFLNRYVDGSKIPDGGEVANPRPTGRDTVDEVKLEFDMVSDTNPEFDKDRFFMKVVNFSVATSSSSIKESKILRSIEVGELAEIHEGPVQVDGGPFRVRSMLMRDDLECWITTSNADGTTTYLEDVGTAYG